MATVTRNEPKPTPATYTLELSIDEAEVLHSLLWRNVIGSTDGPRGTADAICVALGHAGIHSRRLFDGSARGSDV